MTKDEAIAIVGFLKDLMPTLTQRQGIEVGEALLRIGDAEQARNRLREYARNHADFRLADCLAAMKPAPLTQSEVGQALVDRTTSYRADQKAQAAAAQAEWDRVTALIDALSPDELERQRQTALTLMSDRFRQRKATADPRTDPLLRATIAEQLGGVSLDA